MNKGDLLNSIVADLGENYRGDDEVLGVLLDEVINDALAISNRKYKVLTDGVIDDSKLATQLEVLASSIRRCVKSIYLQRGSEDTTNNSIGGLSSTYDDSMQRMRDDIIFNGKRLMA